MWAVVAYVDVVVFAYYSWLPELAQLHLAAAKRMGIEKLVFVKVSKEQIRYAIGRGEQGEVCVNIVRERVRFSI